MKDVTTGPYRRTRRLAPGESTTVSVSARDPWNWTGIYLEPGEYTFTAQGRWTDSGIPSGPEGVPGWRSRNPREALLFASTLLGHGERIFRRVTSNPSANTILTRREDDLPWMSLIGVVASRTYEPRVEALNRHERIAIGVGTSHQIEDDRSGYLYAFANDAWGFYGNNRGSVQLTVTKNSDSSV